MARLMSALRAGVARLGSMMRSIPGLDGIMGKISDGWNGMYGAVADGWEWTMQQADAVWDYSVEKTVQAAQQFDKGVGFTAQAAIHVGQDLKLATKNVTSGAAKFAWNNPLSKIARNVGAFMIEDKRPRLEANKVSKKDAANSVEAAKRANPAELAAVKAAYIKNDPELVERYVGAETLEQRNAIRGEMSPKAQAWVDTLTASDLWSMKGKSSTEIAAHMSGDKALSGVNECKDYYGASKSAAAATPAAPAPEGPMEKTVAERRADRAAAKKAKMDAANGVTPEVGGTVPGQAPEVKSAQQQTMEFFGPKVAKEEEVSEYSQAALPAYRPPVPRKAG